MRKNSLGGDLYDVERRIEMVEDGAERDEVEGFAGTGKEGFDGFVEKLGESADGTDFTFQDVEHVGGDVNDSYIPTATQHFQRDISGATAAIEATHGAALLRKPVFNSFQVIFDPALKECVRGASFIFIIFLRNLLVKLLVCENDLIAYSVRRDGVDGLCAL